MKHTPDDEYILKKFNRGGKHTNRAFNELVLKYGPVLYNLIRKDVKNHEITNDILQDVFLKVFQQLKNFKGESQLFSWLYRITKNHTINTLKKENLRRTENLDSPSFEKLHSEGIVGHLSEEEIEKYFNEALNEIPEKQKIIFELRYFQDLKFSEISGITGTSEGGCKANYHHAKEKIKTFLLNRLNHL